MRTRGNKYGAKRTALFPGGRMYDSTAERDYAAHLQLLLRAGEIFDLVEQPRLELVPGIFYRPDFAFTDKGVENRVDGPRRWFTDVKGVETERFRIVKKLWALVGPGWLQIVKRDGRRSQAFKCVEEIPPGNCTLVNRGDWTTRPSGREVGA